MISTTSSVCHAYDRPIPPRIRGRPVPQRLVRGAPLRPLPDGRVAGAASRDKHLRGWRRATGRRPLPSEPPELRRAGRSGALRPGRAHGTGRLSPYRVRGDRDRPRPHRPDGHRREHGLRRPPVGGVRGPASRRFHDRRRLGQRRTGGRSRCLGGNRRRLAQGVALRRDDQHDPAARLLACSPARSRRPPTPAPASR